MGMRGEGELSGDRNQIIGSSAVTVCPCHQQPMRGIPWVLVTNERPGNQTSSLRLWPAKTNIALNREIVLLRLTKIESSAHLPSTQISEKNTKAAPPGENNTCFLLRIVRVTFTFDQISIIQHRPDTVSQPMIGQMVSILASY